MFFLYFLVPTNFFVLTEWMMNLYSPTSAATDMDIDKNPSTRKLTTQLPPKPVSLLDLNLFG